MEVEIQPYATAAFTAPEILLVLIVVRVCVEPKNIVRVEEMRQRKATFRFVAHCLHQLY